MLAIDYFHPGVNIEDADQIVIQYRPDDPTFVQFISESKKPIYIDATNIEGDFRAQDYEILKKLKEANDNWTLMLRSKIYNKTILDAIKDCCPHLMSTMCYCYWDTLTNHIEEFGEYISEVYIGGSLGFELSQVVEYCHSKGIKVRVIANRILYLHPIKDIRTFFIRPEDVKMYEDIVDAIEIVDLQENPAYMNIAFAAYKRGKWAGNLQEIIYNLDEEIDNSCLHSDFGKYRVECKQRCMRGKCNLCRTLKKTTELIHKVAETTAPEENTDGALDDNDE